MNKPQTYYEEKRNLKAFTDRFIVPLGDNASEIRETVGPDERRLISIENREDRKVKSFSKCLVCIPSISDMVSKEFMIRVQLLGSPMNFNLAWDYPVGYEIGEARNNAAIKALQNNVALLLFLDDDVIFPANAIVELYKTMELTGADIVSGLYYAKALPSAPLVFRDYGTTGFRDFKQGDLIEVTGCLPPDGRIVTPKGLIKISDVNVGDTVFSHKGKERKVLQTFRREYNGSMYKITPYHFNVPVELTSEHPVLVYEDSKYKWIKACNILERDVLVYPINRKLIKPKDIKISDFINKTQYNFQMKLVKTKNKIILCNKHREISNTIKINKSIMRLFGYYIAEGSTTKNFHSSEFSLHIKESSIGKDIKNILQEELGINCSVHLRPKNKCRRVTFSCKPLGILFRSLFGENSKVKHIPTDFLYYNEELQVELLKGLFRGDGHIITERGRKQIGYTTSSEELAYQIRDILIRLGIIPSIVISYNHGIKNKDRYVYRLSITSEESCNLLNSKLKLGKFKQEYITNKNNKQGWIKDNLVYLPVRKITKKKYKDFVHNIEVSKDNSYLTTSFSVHNCGMGVTLINTEIFKKIEPPYFKTRKDLYQNEKGQWTKEYGTEDLYFCEKVFNAGGKILVDTGIFCLHRDRVTGEDYPRDFDILPELSWNNGLNIEKEDKNVK